MLFCFQKMLCEDRLSVASWRLSSHVVTQMLILREPELNCLS